ncbi:MAG: AMP-binding protein [Candidatus Lokiarchaeota archaeon]|nr:AMP-binding protein [Candidatus Lokiarchaeota archaeon]
MVRWTQIPKVETPWKKYYPSETPQQIEYRTITTDEMLKESAQKWPSSAATFFEGGKITYAELDGLATRFAAGLQGMGIKPGDVVLIDLPNIPQFVIAYFGIVRAGATANPIIPLQKYAEIVHQANDSKAKMLVILDSLYEEYLHGKDLSAMKTVKTIVLSGLAEYLSKIKGILGTALGKIPRMKVWPERAGDIVYGRFQDILASGAGKAVTPHGLDPRNAIACLIYTGGTTGTPKGVQMTHFNLVSNCLQGYNLAVTQLDGIRSSEGNGGMVAVLPLAHSFGLTVAMHLGIMNGYTLLLFPRPPTRISDMLKVAAAQNAVFCPGVPTLWNKLNQDPDSPKHAAKLTQFKGCLSGAAALPFDVKEKFEKMTGALITEGFGMSETGPILTANPFKRPRPNSVGVPLADTWIKIVDIEKGDKILGSCPHTEPYCKEHCGPDEAKYIGEICACGPQVMPGYLNKPEETARVLRKDADGITWYYTSDLGCIDNEGYLRIKDRKRDMIKYKGHAVFPREVEDLMISHPAINEVGVYGMKSNDVETGEIIVATVSLKPEYKGKITSDEIMTWCTENLAFYKVPREIKIVDELPKSFVGKVLRRVLRSGEQQPAATEKKE